MVTTAACTACKRTLMLSCSGIDYRNTHDMFASSFLGQHWTAVQVHYRDVSVAVEFLRRNEPQKYAAECG